MRIITLALTFCGLALTAGAQTGSQCLLSQGKTWNCSLNEVVVSDNDDVVRQTTYYCDFIDGDTIVNGLKYYKLYRNLDGSHELTEYLREDSRKVYAWSIHNKEEVLMYDFGASAGECITVGGISEHTVEKVDSVLVGSRLFKRMELYGIKWVEGVGSNFGLSNPCGSLFNDGKEYTLLSCYENGKCIFTKDDFNRPAITGTDVNRCATPTIAYDNGRLLFGCETEGAECVYEIKCSDEGNGRGNEVNLSKTYEIRVYATLEGRYDSDVAVATIGWHNGRPVMEGFSSIMMGEGDGMADVNGDGKVDVADIATVISIMAGQSSE